MKKNILINISVVSREHRGMGNFIKTILLELFNYEENYKEFNFVLVSCTNIDEELKKIIDEKNIVFKQLNISLPIFEQFVIPSFLKQYNIDIAWFPSNTFSLYKPKNIKYIVTIHDIIFLYQNYKPKRVYQKIGKYYRAFNIKRGIKKIDVITSVSKTALKEIYNYFGIFKNINEVNILYNSINLNFNFDDDVLTKYCLKNRKYIYTISGEAPHKNLNFLIKSFMKFNQIYTDYVLVVSGISKFNHFKYKYKNIIFTDFLSESQKNSLIKHADFFVFASLNEGFGIPLIEAMSLNKNILASDIEVFREIGENYVNYFDPKDEMFLIKYMENENKKINDLILIREFLNKKFNVKTSIKKLLSIFKETK